MRSLFRFPRLGQLLPLLLIAGATAEGQRAADLPFGPGETLTYTARFHVKVGGGGTLRVEAPTELRGTTVWVLRSDMQGKFGPVRASERNASWLDPVRFAALQYSSRTRQLLKRHDDQVTILPEEGRWHAHGGLTGTLASAQPLDELSFLYFLRTLPFSADTTLTFARHFDEARNPTIVRVIGREEVEVTAGRFRALIVEMRVRDTRRYKGEGVIRVTLSDDRCRLPLRMESKVPDAGSATLQLASYSGTRADCHARMASK